MRRRTRWRVPEGAGNYYSFDEHGYGYDEYVFGEYGYDEYAFDEREFGHGPNGGHGPGGGMENNEPQDSPAAHLQHGSYLTRRMTIGAETSASATSAKMTESGSWSPVLADFALDDEAFVAAGVFSSAMISHALTNSVLLIS